MAVKADGACLKECTLLPPPLHHAVVKRAHRIGAHIRSLLSCTTSITSSTFCSASSLRFKTAKSKQSLLALVYRYLRHFVTVALPEPDDDALATIYGAILRAHAAAAPPAAAALTESLLAATLEVYRAAASRLLPTPGKPHYTFSARDVCRVVAGLMLPPAERLATGGAAGGARLWTHEALRVFGDRLSSEADSMWLLEAMRSATSSHFGVPLDTACGHVVDKGGSLTPAALQRLMFTDPMSDQVDASKAEREYGLRLPLFACIK